MKISIDDIANEDSKIRAFAQRAIVFLDGKMVERCIEADEEKGYVIKYSDKFDCAFGEWITERLEGKVKIVDPKNL